MDAISAFGTQNSFRTLSQQVRHAKKGDSAAFENGSHMQQDKFHLPNDGIAVQKNSTINNTNFSPSHFALTGKQSFSKSGSGLDRPIFQNSSLLFADSSATTTVDSIENYFKNENLMDTQGIVSDADESREYDSRLWTNLADGNGLSANTKQGTVVNVQRGERDADSPESYRVNISRGNGIELSMLTSDNMRINDLEGGGLSIFFASTGETHIYDAEGNRTDIQQGNAGVLAGTAGDDMLVNLHGSTVEGGAGDDTILNFADNATINAGNGDDTIILGRTVANNTIRAGEGDDRLLGAGAQKNSTLDMGEGNNRVHFGYLGKSSNLTAGNGNNEVTIGKVTDTFGTEKCSSIRLGDGNNTLRSDYFGGDIQLGNGKNTLTTRELGGELVFGSGDNTLLADSFFGQLIGGDGNNSIEIRLSGSNIGVGSSTMFLGHGNNNIDIDTLDNADVIVGNGKNTASIRSTSKSNIVAGKGNNTVSIDSMFQATLVSGKGNNTIDIRASRESRVTTGTGNNSISIKSSFSPDLIDGNDTALMKALKDVANRRDIGLDNMRSRGFEV